MVQWNRTLHIQDNSDQIRTYVRINTYRRHPISCPHRQAMGCLLWGFGEKMTTISVSNCITLYQTTTKHNKIQTISIILGRPKVDHILHYIITFVTSGLTKYRPQTGNRELNTLRPRQNGRHLPDDIFKNIFLNETVRISIKMSLKFVLKGPFNNIPALVQIMAWRRPGDKPLSEPMMDSLPTHICVTRPQWVNASQFHQRHMFDISGTSWQLAICLSRHVITAVESIKQSDCETLHLVNGIKSQYSSLWLWHEDR